jgi:hypothetical protein
MNGCIILTYIAHSGVEPVQRSSSITFSSKLTSKIIKKFKFQNQHLTEVKSYLALKLANIYSLGHYNLAVFNSPHGLSSPPAYNCAPTAFSNGKYLNYMILSKIS